MSETTPTAPPTAPTAPQTSNIFVDRPCLKCGYNLRGQTATWNRRALNWQVTCPECGGAQVVVLGSAERGGGHSIVTLVLAITGVWVAWELITSLAIALGAMMGPLNAQLMRSIVSSPTVMTRRSAFDYDAITLVTYFLVQGIPLALSAVLLGALISIAPYARAQDRNFVLALLVLGAIVYGIYLDLTGLLPNRSNIGADGKWKLMSGTIGLALAYFFSRVGLAAGRPFAKMITGMYVKAAD
jgi:hypothetical protein